MTILTIFTLLTAVLYIWPGIVIIRSMKDENSSAASWVRWPVLAGLVIQAFCLHAWMYQSGTIEFGFGHVLADISFFALIIFLIETWIHRLHGQFGIALVGAGVLALFPVLFPGSPIEASEWTTFFKLHLFFAIGGYSFMAIALIHAVLLTLQNRRLKLLTIKDDEGGFLSSLPALVVMERIFFRIVSVGFAFITLTLVFGAVATHEQYDVWFRFDHKTVLTWLAWIVFGILLLGRSLAGWRAKRALSWFWGGFGLFVIAYFGYSVIVELSGMH